MEENIGNGVSLSKVAALHVSRLSRSEANGDDLVDALLNELPVHLVQHLENLRDARLVALEGVAVLAGQCEGLAAGEARGDLLCCVGCEVHLEAQVEHVLGQLGGGEGGGVGVGLGLLEDAREGVQSILGVEDGGVVEGVAHDGRIEFGDVISVVWIGYSE